MSLGGPGLVGARECETDNGIAVEGDEEGSARGPRRGQRRLPLGSEGLFRNALGVEGVLPHEGAPGLDLQASNRARVAALSGTHGAVGADGRAHRPIT